MQPDRNMSVQEWLLFTEKENTLPYLLSDLGYDVWIGNNRGTIDFSSHETLDPVADSEEYWNFSFMEQGRFDLEAEIKFIKAVTKVDKMTFLGYGHGSTQAFYGLATRET
jgi:lysosomal acid lipase/cholesteryl ester hydrolase